jgi:hypothetical protein
VIWHAGKRFNCCVTADAWRHCYRGHVILLHSCIIQVFIAAAWQQTRRGDARLVTARHGSTRLDSARLCLALLGLARRKHHFVYCCLSRELVSIFSSCMA